MPGTAQGAAEGEQLETEYTTLSSKGRLTIPAALRDALDLHEGDRLMIRVVGGMRLELIPLAMVPRDQVWFYHPEMQRRVLEAELDIRQGKVARVSTGADLDEFFESLD